MTQSDFWSEELPANHSLLQDLGKDLKIQEAILLSPMLEFLTTLDPSGSFGKMCQVSLVAGGGRDFGSFLGALGELGYGWSYRVLDAQYFGVAQRRRRVFVVGCLGDWRPTAEVLFESESLCRNIKKGRKEKKETSKYAGRGIATISPTIGCELAKQVNNQMVKNAEAFYIPEFFEFAKQVAFDGRNIRDFSNCNFDTFPTLTASDYKTPKMVCYENNLLIFDAICEYYKIV